MRPAILLATLALFTYAFTMLAVTALRAPAPVTGHFGPCPAGQHWEQTAPFPGWNCVR